MRLDAEAKKIYTSKVMLTAYIERQQKDALIRLAKKGKRSLASVVREILDETIVLDGEKGV